MNEIANNIKRLRKEKGLSQEQMAETLHVTRQTVSAWERGIAQPSLDTLEEIAGALNVDTEHLLYGKAAEPQRSVYRTVSFLPVLGVVPLYLLMTLVVFPIPMLAWLGDDNLVFLLCGQMFLSMLIVGCYCALKDLICNREYYERLDDEEKMP